MKLLKVIKKCILATSLLSTDNDYLTQQFTTGELAFDLFIKHDALKEKDTGYGVTYLVADVTDNKNIVLVAYYTLATNSIPYIDIQIEDNGEKDEKICGILRWSSKIVTLV